MWFPSAEKEQQGPLLAELLYEDTRRDLAFLRVKTALPPLRVAGSYRFRKGEDVTVIGNPGVGYELVLENAISRGLMSTKTALEGQRYYQLTIAVNPGNSGGPVFNSFGSVIGVVTRKSVEQESLAFCIPVEDLNLALGKVDTFPQDAIERQQSRHRLVLAVKQLGSLGALYSMVIASRRQKQGDRDAAPTPGFFFAIGPQSEGRRLLRLKAEVDQVRQDHCLSQEVRAKVGQLADNLEKLKTLYAAQKPGKDQDVQFPDMQSTHRRLILDLCKALDLNMPDQVLFALSDPEQKSDDKGGAKDGSTERQK